MSQDVVASWAERAEAYAALVRVHPVFGRMADRLVGALPEGPAPRVADLAAGTGLVSERLLARRPDARVWLVEPAAPMLALAREALGVRASGYAARTAEDWHDALPELDGVLINAALHLCDERRVFAEAGARLVPGGRLAANLWWHSFDQTAGSGPRLAGRAALDRALAEQGREPVVWPRAPRPRQRTEAGLRQDAARAGLALLELARDEDEVDPALEVDFAAMATPVRALPPELRESVLARARALARTWATARDRIHASVRLVLERIPV